MNYKEAEKFLLGLIDFEKITDFKYDFDLDSFREFLSHIGSPQNQIRNPILIAGTKGKGSTASFLASALTRNGYTAGLYTSPHLINLRERIRVDGRPIKKAEFARILDEIRPFIEKRHFRTFFEVLTTVAFLYFIEKKVDFSILEVGMGGRLDATNVCDPLLSIITSISYDHTEILGDTLQKITREKAGIIRENGFVISAPQEKEVKRVLEAICEQKGSKLLWVNKNEAKRISKSKKGQTFEIEGFRFRIPLLGMHEIENGAVAYHALKMLGEKGFRLDMDRVREGFRSVKWRGRLDIIGRNPYFVLDGAHNVESCEALQRAIEDYFKYNRLILILGISSGKDVKGIIDTLAPLADIIIFTRADAPRAIRPEILRKEYRGTKRFCLAKDVRSAQKMAKRMAKSDDLILATGSLYLVGEILGTMRAARQRLGDS